MVRHPWRASLIPSGFGDPPMWADPASVTLGAVLRFILDIDPDGGDRVSGQLAREGRPPVPFSGWLELLQLLEDRSDDQEAPFEGAEQ